MMFSMGITLTIDDFKRVFAKPRVIGLGFFACYALMPALAFVIGNALGLSGPLLAGLILVGSINGGQASNLCAYIAKGDVALSVLMTTATTVGCIFMTPLICKLALGAVVESCVFIHQSVERKSRAFLEQLRRYNYVTPTSYLELLRTFTRLLGEKRAEIELQRSRLRVGLDKLESTAAQVGVMEKELVELQPVLARTSTEVEEMIAVITADTAVADETKTKVLAQEKAANEKAAEAKAIADDAQADLDKALPALDAAVQALKLLTKNDIVEVKALKNPPAGVRLVQVETAAQMMQAVQAALPADAAILSLIHI